MNNRRNQLLFIQFLHPGSEHTPDKNNPNHISWNQSKHKRKFIKNPGAYLEGDRKNDSDLIFWGEWEPQSDVIQELEVKQKKVYPKYLYQPYYSIIDNKQFLQNTDPFVFGNNFYYVCCRQATKRGSTKLRFLERGSVILFGSCLNKQFVLDTVFVVDSYVDIESLEQISQHVPETDRETYVDVTLKHILDNTSDSCIKKNESNCTASQNFHLYTGAKFDNPVNDMFSFFPCLPYKQNSNIGFIRPAIQVSDISPNLNQNFKILNSKQGHQQLWQQVRRQVEQAGLKIGIHSKLPPKK